MMRNRSGLFYANKTVVLHYHQYRATMQSGHRRFDLFPGDITLSPPGELSSYAIAEDGFHWCIHFHPAPASVAPETRIPLYLRARPELAPVLARMQQITDWHRRANGSDPAKKTLRAAGAAALQEVLLCLASERTRPSHHMSTNRTSAALQRVVEWIDGNLEKAIVTPDLVREANLSQNYLSRLFRQRYGVTLQHYLLLRRIEVARHLLLSTNDRIKEVGIRVGLPDPQHFNKQFRRVTGMSPGHFREGAKT
jgi:AraC-like DNA-binding protein